MLLIKDVLIKMGYFSETALPGLEEGEIKQIYRKNTETLLLHKVMCLLLKLFSTNYSPDDYILYMTYNTNIS